MTDQELMQQALDALEYASDQTKPENLHGCDCLICTTILALRDRLAQLEQEPVAYRYKMPVEDDHWVYNFCQFPDDKLNPNLEPLYTTPPQRSWVGLTNEQIMDCTYHMAKENDVWIVTDNGLLEFAHILEETIRRKNK